MAASHLTVCQILHDQDGKAVFLAPFSVALRPQRPYRCFTPTEAVQMLYAHRDRTDCNGRASFSWFLCWFLKSSVVVRHNY